MAGLGHEDVSVAEDCTRLLNVIYDGNHWQLYEPFEPVIAYRGAPFEVSVSVEGTFAYCFEYFDTNRL